MQKIFTIKTPKAMEKLGAQIGRALVPGSVVYLYGDLGAGKTTLVRGLLRELGHKGAVKSPTFTLLESYQFADTYFYHFDLYRLNDPEELELIGVRDYFTEKSVCLIEWPERGKNYLPPADLICEFTFLEHGRSILFVAKSLKGDSIFKCN